MASRITKWRIIHISTLLPNQHLKTKVKVSPPHTTLHFHTEKQKRSKTEKNWSILGCDDEIEKDDHLQLSKVAVVGRSCPFT